MSEASTSHEISSISPINTSHTAIETNTVEHPTPLIELNIPDLQLKEMIDKAISTSNVYADLISAPPTSQTALNLRAFSIILEAHKQKRDFSEQDIIKDLARTIITEQEEIESIHLDNLPTIGLEVEINKNRLPFPEDAYTISGNYGDSYSKTHLIKQLKRLGLNIIIEKSGDEPTEIIFPPSYSASTQNRMLIELKKIGIIPIDKSFTSLHINLGYTHLGENEDDHIKTTSRRISDLITYGFVPSKRVRDRSHSTSVINKDIHNDEVTKIEKLNNMPTISRTEFRTPRINGPATYELIKKIQVLGTLLNNEASTLTQEFNRDVDALLNKYKLESNLPQTNQSHAADTIRHAQLIRNKAILQARKKHVALITDKSQPQKIDLPPNLIDDSRQLIDKYYRNILHQLLPNEQLSEYEFQDNQSYLAAD